MLLYTQKHLATQNLFTYKVKRCHCRFLKKKFNERPSIKITNPDVYLNIHIAIHTTCTISLDSSGESLHKRGLSEVLKQRSTSQRSVSSRFNYAHRMERRIGFSRPHVWIWNLLIEAAMIALNISGVFRKEFAFENGKILTVKYLIECIMTIATNAF